MRGGQPPGTIDLWAIPQGTAGSAGQRKNPSPGIPFVKGISPLTNTYAGYPNFTDLRVIGLPASQNSFTDPAPANPAFSIISVR